MHLNECVPFFHTEKRPAFDPRSSPVILERSEGSFTLKE